jgi:hypothetical protein
MAGMKKHTFTTIGLYGFLFAGLIAVAVSFLFITATLRAASCYKQARRLRKPQLQSEKVNYYKRIFSLISKAARLNPDNADYHVAKADYLMRAIGDGLKEELFIKAGDIEDSYLKAISLIPANFFFHLRLGWFYVQYNDKKAEETLKQAGQLSPNDYRSYLYLSQYYFENKEETEGFFNLILSAHYAHVENRFNELGKVRKQIEHHIKDLSLVSPTRHFQAVKYTLYPEDFKLDLKQEGFPHEKIHLVFRVYTQDPSAKVGMYRRHIRFGDFKRVDLPYDYIVYEFELKEYPASAYLDDFSIGIEGASTMDKVEILKYLVAGPSGKVY